MQDCRLVSIEARIQSKFDFDPDTGCWVWLGTVNKDGYGVLTVGSRIDGSRALRYAHVLSWEFSRGPVSDGLELDHLCRQRRCINPAHLEPVTHAENIRRGRSLWRERTHCPKGHPYSGVNLIQTATQRVCRACKTVSQERYRIRVLLK